MFKEDPKKKQQKEIKNTTQEAFKDLNSSGKINKSSANQHTQQKNDKKKKKKK